MGAALVWATVAATSLVGWWAVALLAPAFASRRLWVVALVFAALISGGAVEQREAATHEAAVPAGRVTVVGRLTDDPKSSGGGLQAPFDPTHLLVSDQWERWRGPRLSVVFPASAPALKAGDVVRITGSLRPWPGRLRGNPVAGILDVGSVEALAPAIDPAFRAGNAVRNRVLTVLGDRGKPAALLAGFLIGVTEGLPAADAENLRRAGLSHFVAVSGSNVALFLGAWFLAAGPLGWTPGRRAALGLAGLTLFVVVTRWEASVVRAAFMAGLVLVGRVGGVALTPWAALGWAVVAALLIAPQLAGAVGFQLSVAATAGVLTGGRFAQAHGYSSMGLSVAITMGAQAAVAPILLWHFDTVPLLAPVANLAAAPLVTVGTGLAGLAVLTGLPWVVTLATWPASAVLAIARHAAGWPQIGLSGLGGTVIAALAWLRLPTLRPIMALCLSGLVALSMLPAATPSQPTLVFLDVGQGDAALLLNPRGETVLVDGGPDAGRLLDKLREWGVVRVDLVVATHGDLDHIGGLAAVLESYPVGRLWHPSHAEGSDSYRELLELATGRGIPVEQPQPGWRVEVGSATIDVLGPARRYAAINDESIVLRVDGGGRTALLTGDIEATAQHELGLVPVDVLKVPHHGAATTDLTWLRASAPATAVVSVGPNDFGHPAPTVLAVLDEAGSEVLRTDHEGDIIIPLGP